MVFVRLLLSFYWEQGALFFVLGLSAGHLCAKTVGGMLILTLRGDRYAIGKEPGKAEPFENTERLSRPGLRLTDELELRFLENLREHGRTKGTISTYRRNLSKLRKYLPEDSNLDPAFLSSWQSELLEQGYSPGTVNSCTATVNGLLEFAGRRDLQAGQIYKRGSVFAGADPE